MKKIDGESGIILQLLGKQKISENLNYRPLKYVRKIEVPEGQILFNSLTGEMILLECAENSAFSFGADIKNPTTAILIEKWFLVPENHLDNKLSKEVLSFIQSLNTTNKSKKLKTFVILPTTDCNARCFYCFELSCQRKWMTKKTADDVVEYIMRKKDDGTIKIHWFGGEPLYNSEIIDYISSELLHRGVVFTSHMISNAYLFDDAMVKRAKELWKLKKIQVTIDGTEQIYNKVKAYIYKDSTSPFKRVIENIKKLLNYEITVHIRLNMDMHNIDDLFKLSDYLYEEFKNYEELYIYPHLLYDTGVKIMANRNEEFLNKRYLELKKSLDERCKRKAFYTEIMRYTNHCMANTDSSIMILPEGQLGKCEHYTDDHFVGSIYSDEIDYTMYDSLKELSTPSDSDCDDCEMRTACIYLKNCPNHQGKCSEFKKKVKENSFDDFIRYIYNYKINQNVLDKENEDEIQDC